MVLGVADLNAHLTYRQPAGVSTLVLRAELRCKGSTAGRLIKARRLARPHACRSRMADDTATTRNRTLQ